jgi:CBS-domain-containing membrane protein
VTSVAPVRHRLRVIDVMRTPAITVCPPVSPWVAWPLVAQVWVRVEDDLQEVAQVMVRARVRVVRVLDVEGTLVGTLTAADLIDAVARFGIAHDTIDVCG